jgi:hypothetical protein
MDLAAILARKIALSLPAWQCAQAKNEEQAGASIDRPEETLPISSREAMNDHP